MFFLCSSPLVQIVSLFEPPLVGFLHHTEEIAAMEHREAERVRLRELLARMSIVHQCIRTGDEGIFQRLLQKVVCASGLPLILVAVSSLN